MHSIDEKTISDDASNTESNFAVQDAALSPDLPRKLTTKIDLHVVPTLCVVYLVSFLDRVNISNALIYKLPEDLGLQGYQINIALALLFVTYVTFEIPATVLMKRLRPQRFLPACTLIFGVLLMCHGFVQNFAGLIALRMIMGVFEAGIYPSCYYLISMWYKQDEAARRFAFFYAGCSLAGAFGGLLATAIGYMEGIGGYHAWRWIFILEGLLTVLIGVISLFTVSDFPEAAKWLSLEERYLVTRRLAADQGESEVDAKITLKDLRIILNWKVLLSAPLYFGFAASIYGLAFFIPSIVKGYGYSPIQAQLHSVIPWVVSLVFALSMAYLSDRYRMRSPFILLGFVLGLCGNIMLFTIHDNINAEYAALFLYLMGCVGATPVVVVWYTMSLRGHRERAIGIPYMIGLGNVSGVVGTFAFPAKDAPRYTLGYSLGLGFLSMAGLITVTYIIGFSIENRKRLGKDRYML